MLITVLYTNKKVFNVINILKDESSNYVIMTDIISNENILIRTLVSRCYKNREVADELGGYINPSPDFQRAYELWTPLRRTRLIETVLAGGIINPLWVIQVEENYFVVMDGQHRLRHILDFVSGCTKFGRLKGKHFMRKEFATKYDGKMYDDLNVSDRKKLMNYKLTINYLDERYYNDKDLLRAQYFLLNGANTKINQYQMHKVYWQALDTILASHEQAYQKSYINNGYNKRRSVQEGVKAELEQILIASFIDHYMYNGTRQMVNIWKQSKGENFEMINNWIIENTNTINKRLKHIIKILDSWCFHKKFPSAVPYEAKFAIAISAKLTKDNISLWNRHSKNILDLFSKKVFLKKVEGEPELVDIMEEKSRGAQFQKKVYNHIIDLVTKELDLKNPKNARRFTKSQCQEMLERQKYICPLCDEKILPTHEKCCDHHPIAWTNGGETTKENGRALHKRCHEKKQ